jgi:hypothetical protein
MTLGERVIGVVDVRSAVANAFGETTCGCW